jgi:peptide subunit release factor 1 (eRF1)
MWRISVAEDLAQRERLEALLAEPRERGTSGLGVTMKALEEGRVNHVMVPWPARERVMWCDSCALAFSGSQSCPYCSRRTRERELVDAVLELAQARGTRMEFLRGESADLLREGFDGLAGLVRF